MTAEELQALLTRAGVNDSTLTSKDVNGLLRACVKAAPGHVLVVADFSGIEARVLAWAAGDFEALEVFRTPGGDPYKRLASKLYGIPVEDVTKAQRQLGKIAELAAGYGMGPDKLEITGAKMGVDWAASGLDPGSVVAGYRDAHQPIVAWWRAMQDSAVLACDGYTTRVGPVGRPDQAAFVWGPSPLRPRGLRGQHGDVWLMLPSGRPVSYYNMAYTLGRQGPELTFQGRRGLDRTYSGKLTENAVQAFARELLGRVLAEAEATGLAVVGHIHDEVILEVPVADGDAALEWLLATMRIAPAWAVGLPLNAEGWVGDRYRK